MKKIILILILLIVQTAEYTYSCTSIIVSGKYTADGRPLMWKNRDSDYNNNRLMYFSDGKYSYIGLVNSEDKIGKEIWAGFNSAGLSIMNTASYNLNLDDSVQSDEQEGIIMKWAMQFCSTIQDFQNMLDTLKKPYPVEANFGLIDAKGGAAYFEVSSRGYTKYDVNDPMVAPMGYLIRTNYSFSGTTNEGSGYERYAIAEEVFYNAASTNSLTPQYIIQQASRCMRHGVTKINLKELASNSDIMKMVDFRDFIPRSLSTSAIVIQGVKLGESPDYTVMWTVLGFPLGSVAYPVWLNDAQLLPDVLKADETGNAPLCDKTMKLKDLCFPIKRGNGEYYLNINALYNNQSTGIMQKLQPLENYIFKFSGETIEKWRKSKPASKEIKAFYQLLDSKIIAEYKTLFDL